METYIRFMAPVIPETAQRLFQIIDAKMQQGIKVIHLLISSPGGSVFHGLSLYNYLKGIPIEVRTYNFGSVDSIGVIMFCAGTQRFSVPHARFLMHGVKMNLNGGGQISLDEKQLEEHLKSLKIDQLNIAKVISDTVKNKSVEGVEADMNNRTTLNPEEGVAYGLVHEIKSELVPQGADLVVIGEPLPQGMPMIPGIHPGFARGESIPNTNAYSRSIDLSIGTYLNW